MPATQEAALEAVTSKNGGAHGPLEAVERHPVGKLSHDGTNMSSVFWAFSDLTIHGRFIRNFGFPNVDIRHDSQVCVSITELRTQDNRPFIGDAAMGILNVAPDPVDGTVWVRADVDWPSNLRVRLNFVILN
jgi:hypothetical protein